MRGRDRRVVSVSVEEMSESSIVGVDVDSVDLSALRRLLRYRLRSVRSGNSKITFLVS